MNQIRRKLKWQKIEIFDSFGTRYTCFTVGLFNNCTITVIIMRNASIKCFLVDTKKTVQNEGTCMRSVVSFTTTTNLPTQKCTAINAIETYKLKSRSDARAWVRSKQDNLKKNPNTQRWEKKIRWLVTHIERAYSFLSVHINTIVTFVIRYVAHRNLFVIQSNTKCALFACE